MQSTPGQKADRALIVVHDLSAAQAISAACTAKGIDGMIETDEQRALDRCRNDPPDLAIVGDPLESMSAYDFVTELLRISWTVSTILMTAEDAETVHEKAEGLGIVGHISHPGDRDKLLKLLDYFKRLKIPGSSGVGSPD
jgi:DNA-binding response OmpR family regulator